MLQKNCYLAKFACPNAVVYLKISIHTGFKNSFKTFIFPKKVRFWVDVVIARLLEHKTLIHQEVTGSNLAKYILFFWLLINLPSSCQNSPKFKWFKCQLPQRKVILNRYSQPIYPCIKWNNYNTLKKCIFDTFLILLLKKVTEIKMIIK